MRRMRQIGRHSVVGTFPRRAIARLALIIASVLGSAAPPASNLRTSAAPEPQDTRDESLGQLVNPTTIQLPRRGTRTKLQPNQDYIIRLPSGKNGFTMIEGGRNIVITGGSIVMRPPRGSGKRVPDFKRRAIYIKSATGTVRIENVFIRGKRGAEFDAIAIAAPQAVVELVNIRVVGVRGRVKGFHGDIVQPFGGVKKLVVNGLAGRSNYQGFYLQRTRGPIGSVELRNINLSYIRNRSNATTFLLWLSGCGSFPVTLENVYIQPRPRQSVGRSAVYPSTIRPAGCKAVQVGNEVSWPSISAVRGKVIEGRPPGGDFASGR